MNLPKPRTLFYLFAIFIPIIFLSCNQPGNKSYPSRPVSFLVPWAPGGMTDLSSRAMAASLQNVLGTPVNVVNRTGGGGVVGHTAISQAQPDGYTLGAVTVEITMMHRMGVTQLTHQDYTPLALMINNPASITVRADAPWENIDELIEEIRNHPGELQASGTARGGIWDLARIGFLEAAGLPESAMPWVPSQGSAPALQELIAEGVDVVTASLSEVDALRKAGQVKTLAVMAEDRLPQFPEIPTLKETGIDWSIGGWVSICAPKNLPAPIRATLDSAIMIAAKDSLFTSSMSQAGSNIQYLHGEKLIHFLTKQDSINGAMMKNAGIGQ